MLDNFWLNIQYGMNHILNFKTYTHILFLLVLTVPYAFKDWKRILLLVTMFTLGHTVSLLLAFYGIVSIKGTLIAFLIPITILVVALYNVFTAGKKAPSEKVGILFLSTVFFGLIQGLSFVGNFKMFTAKTDSKIVPLIGIEIGIELGQIIVAFAVLFLGFLCETIFRFSKRDWIVVLSAIVVGVIIPMLINNKLFF
ncbi:HupE/UreJ family protein [Gelidibacter sp.]|uniref:HupE/UreJ family protein n=1 Tax=Gelidibacter sp. TaxID=2018083 RepID=UPI00326736DD